jgi:hypothetical protein
MYKKYSTICSLFDVGCRDALFTPRLLYKVGKVFDFLFLRSPAARCALPSMNPPVTLAMTSSQKRATHVTQPGRQVARKSPPPTEGLIVNFNRFE